MLKFAWVDAPKWLAAAIAISLGWVAAIVFPQLVVGIGWDGTTLVLVGGLCYTIGGLIYALRRPNPLPAVFGYHEIFHVLVVAAVALQYSVVTFWLVHPLELARRAVVLQVQRQPGGNPMLGGDRT